MPSAPEPVRFTVCGTCSRTLGIPVRFPATVADAERHSRAHSEPDAARSIADAFAEYATDTRALTERLRDHGLAQRLP